MSQFAGRVFTQIANFMKGLSPMKQISLGGVLIAIIAAMSFLFVAAGEKTFQPLWSNLAPEDSANIIRFLQEKNIPFKMDPAGKSITVPPESVDQLRIQLSTMGLPQNSAVGYEVFDKQSLGTTSFVQKVNEKRAREGELMRTIDTIRGVKRSRVHLALPTKSAFVEDQKKPTASVVIDLEPGIRLDEKQVYGIGNLVARAIEGMDVADVVIVDSNGKVLSKNASDPLAAATASQLDFRQKVEQDMEKRIEAMLSRVVGDGHVVARVSADLDFSQVNETQTIYDADGAAVLSNQKDMNSMEGSRPSASGAAGVISNQPAQPPGAAAMVKNDTKRNSETTNYKIPETVRRTTKPTGQVKKLSVAVMIDGKPIKSTGADGKTESKVESWSPEKVKEFEDMVAGTVGLDRKRGDTLEIRNMAFTHEDFEEAERLTAERDRKSYIQTIILYSVVGLTILLFFFLVVRPFIKWLTENTIDNVDSFLPQTLEELEKMQKNAMLPGMEDLVPVLPDQIDPEKVEGEMIKEKIVTLVDANPHKAALILRDWLHGEARKAAAAAAAAKEDGGGSGKSKTA